MLQMETWELALVVLFLIQGGVMAWAPCSASPAIAASTSCGPLAPWQLLHNMVPQLLNHGASELCTGST